jgi:hypothetical protein
MGNCGFGVAPCPAALRETVMRNLSVVEGMATIRTAVLGDEASLRETVTPQEMQEMKSLLRGALQAGAAGFASSFSPNHRGWGGRPMPSTIAMDDELKGLALELKHANRGVFVMAPLERTADLPGGGTRMIRRPRGVHGVWVNGLRVFDGAKYIRRQSGPGTVIRTFDP